MHICASILIYESKRSLNSIVIKTFTKLVGPIAILSKIYNGTCDTILDNFTTPDIHSMDLMFGAIIGDTRISDYWQWEGMSNFQA